MTSSQISYPAAPANSDRLEPIRSDFTVRRGDAAVPTSFWAPAQGEVAGLVLIGHGGYGYRTDGRTCEVARGFAQYGLASMAIDGPVHGDRRADGGRDPEAVKPDWQQLWHVDPKIDDVVEDWRAALAHAREVLPGLPVGYFGLSMGSLYGVPLLAAEPDTFGAAVVGMWGASNHTGARLVADAATLALPVLHYVRWDDQVFDRPGLLELFDALGSADKQLLAVPGPHGNPDARQTELLTAFLADRLVEKESQ